jgi:hypothetical protein
LFFISHETGKIWHFKAPESSKKAIIFSAPENAKIVSFSPPETARFYQYKAPENNKRGCFRPLTGQ